MPRLYRGHPYYWHPVNVYRRSFQFESSKFWKDRYKIGAKGARNAIIVKGAMNLGSRISNRLKGGYYKNTEWKRQNHKATRTYPVRKYPTSSYKAYLMAGLNRRSQRLPYSHYKLPARYASLQKGPATGTWRGMKVSGPSSSLGVLRARARRSKINARILRLMAKERRKGYRSLAKADNPRSNTLCKYK